MMELYDGGSYAVGGAGTGSGDCSSLTPMGFHADFSRNGEGSVLQSSYTF